MKWLDPPLQTACWYATFGALWIFFSDRLLAAMATAETVVHAQTVKGVLFISATSLFLYYLLRRERRRRQRKEEEKRRLFEATTHATQHILNNFLNNMMLFKVEARHDSHTPEQALALYDQVIAEAKKQIEILSTIQEPTAERIRDSLYPKK